MSNEAILLEIFKINVTLIQFWKLSVEYIIARTEDNSSIFSQGHILNKLGTKAKKKKFHIGKM